MRRLAALCLALVLTAGCGGGSSTSTSAPPPSTGNNGGQPPATSSAVQDMHAVAVIGGAITSGIDIAVTAPGTASGPNAEMLGVSELGAGTTARNSGAAIRRGTTMKVVLFGRALSGNLRVSIGGPPDIIVSNIRSVSATDGTAGVAFDAAVSSSAAIGARTVYLRSANDDITAFTGGLEVIP